MAEVLNKREGQGTSLHREQPRGGAPNKTATSINKLGLSNSVLQAMKEHPQAHWGLLLPYALHRHSLLHPAAVAEGEAEAVDQGRLSGCGLGAATASNKTWMRTVAASGQPAAGASTEKLSLKPLSLEQESTIATQENPEAPDQLPTGHLEAFPSRGRHRCNPRSCIPLGSKYAWAPLLHATGLTKSCCLDWTQRVRHTADSREEGASTGDGGDEVSSQGTASNAPCRADSVRHCDSRNILETSCGEGTPSSVPHSERSQKIPVLEHDSRTHSGSRLGPHQPLLRPRVPSVLGSSAPQQSCGEGPAPLQLDDLAPPPSDNRGSERTPTTGSYSLAPVPPREQCFNGNEGAFSHSQQALSAGTGQGAHVLREKATSESGSLSVKSGPGKRGREEDMHAHCGDRKQRRLKCNRESAKRARIRKQERKEELEELTSKQTKEKAECEERLSEAIKVLRACEELNRELKDEIRSFKTFQLSSMSMHTFSGTSPPRCKKSEMEGSSLPCTLRVCPKAALQLQKA